MSEMSLAWHRSCAQSWERSLNEKEAQLLSELALVERSRIDLSFYYDQIVEAEGRGMDAFDRDRFSVIVLIKHGRALSSDG